jgi:hypothetical protein
MRCKQWMRLLPAYVVIRNRVSLLCRASFTFSPVVCLLACICRYLAALEQAQWIQCDIRKLDMTVLGKFGVVRSCCGRRVSATLEERCTTSNTGSSPRAMYGLCIFLCLDPFPASGRHPAFPALTSANRRLWRTPLGKSTKSFRTAQWLMTRCAVWTLAACKTRGSSSYGSQVHGQASAAALALCVQLCRHNRGGPLGLGEQLAPTGVDPNP